MLSFGGFLNSSFWSSYRCNSSTSIEDLLGKEDCSVEKILEDDDCLQEFKNLNEKLIGFFDHDKLKKLIDYITVMPPVDADNKIGHKFPFVASEIFNCEINQLLDRFFEKPEQKNNEQVPSDQEEEDEDKHQEEEKVEEVSQQKEEEVPSTIEVETTKEEEVEEGQTQLIEPVQIQEQEPGVENEPVVEKEPEVEQEQVETKTSEEQQPLIITETTEMVSEEVTSEQPQPIEETKQEEIVEQQKQNEQDIYQESGLLDNKEKLVEDKISQETTEASTRIQEPEPEEEEEQTDKDGYQLLERLFKFIKTKNTPLNPVLSGYFAKLVTLLINRKQKQIIPYVFQENPDIIDSLLYHVYQKSLSELLNKFLNVMVHDFEGEVAQKIEAKQHEVMSKLIEKLGPEGNEEDNLNACSIIQDMLEVKEFYNIVCKRPNVEKLATFAFTTEENRNKDSQNAALSVLNSLVQLYHDKYKRPENKKGESAEDEEDNIKMQSDEEDEMQESPLVEVLKQHIKSLPEYLQLAIPDTRIVTAYDNSEHVPFGHLRLRLVELVHLLIKLNNKSILDALADSDIFLNISELLAMYPWNNFLQLKTIAIYEDLLENSSPAFRATVLEKSNIGRTILRLSEHTNFQHESTRPIRHGYMATVIKLANLLEKHKDKDEVRAYLITLGEEWSNFLEGEFKNSNTLNNRSICNQTPRNQMDEDDDSAQYEVNMEKIMARFTNFNAISQSSNNDDDEEAEEEKHQEEQESQQQKSPEKTVYPEDQIQEVLQTSLVQDELKKDFVDGCYWKINLYQDANLEELMKDLS